MRVVYDEQVKKELCKYERILKKRLNNKYVVDSERRKNKIGKFRKFLQSLGNKIDELPICDKVKLGQVLNSQNQPLNKGLKQTNYKDESNFVWRISLFQDSKNVVKIYRLLGGNAVDESLFLKLSLDLLI